MFKLETHCHTSEVSGCSRLPAVQLVTQLKRSGYGGAVITDHFHHGYFDSLTGSWTQKIDCFLSGYRAACEAGAQAGLHIYCGLEFRTTTSDNDYLLFGATPELLYSTPELHRYTIPQLRALADEKEVHYVDVAEGVMDDEGYLPFEATGDGVHLTPEYCVVWMDYLRTHTAQ